MRYLCPLRTVFTLILLCVCGFAWPALAQPASSSVTTGTILCAYWREVPGSRISDLTTQPTFPDLPNEQVYLQSFEIPENQEGGFGTLVRGYVIPPQDGLYTFYIASNNQSELWLSADDNPAGKTSIASVQEWSMPRAWTNTPQQQSKPIQLKAGSRYYIEVCHKNGGGDNHLAVAWKLPDATMEAPIPGTRLAAARPVVVPPPRVSLPSLPIAAGVHRLTVDVDYLAQHISLPLLLTLPPDYQPGRQYPAVVFLPDTEREPDQEGFYLQGPDQTPPANPAALAVHRFIGISPQCPSDRTYEQRVTIQAMAAAIAETCSRYPIDRRHIGLTGTNTGGTAVWRLAAEMPGFYGVLSPICGREVKDPRLPQRLSGTHVRIVTDIAEGFATECANRMNEALASAQPKPEVVYLDQRQLGESNAADYCYSRPEFYRSLLGYEEPPSLPSRPSWLVRNRARIVWVSSLFVVAGAVYAWRRRRRASSRTR